MSNHGANTVQPPPARTLEEEITAQISRLRWHRLGRLHMNVCVLDERQDLMNMPMQYRVQDVCQIMSEEVDLYNSRKGIRGVGRYVPKRIYLDPRFHLISGKFDELIRQFQVQAVQNGDSLVRSGGRKNTKSRFGNCLIHLRCTCSDRYRGKKLNKETNQLDRPSDLRPSSLVNDRLNNRHGQEGRSSSRHTITTKPLTKQDPTCPFNIRVFLGPKGYFLQAW